MKNNEQIPEEEQEEQIEEEVDESNESTDEAEELEEDTPDERDEEVESLKKDNAILKRKLKKANKQTEEPSEDATKSEKKEGFDYGEKAFLLQNDIKTPEEMELISEIMSDTGKSLDHVVNSKHAKAELESLRESATVEAATPRGTKRSGAGAKSKVDYWVKKDGLPEDKQLAREVVNARIKADTRSEMFQ